MLSPIMIVVEGGIGAGKSTFCKVAEKVIPAKGYYEPVETGTMRSYLERLRQNPKEVALEFQFWLMVHRYRLHQEAVQYIWKEQKPVIMDRSIWGDKVFSNVLHKSGLISDDGYRCYMEHRKLMEKSLLVPHMVIHLQRDAQHQKESIIKRGRSEEKDLSLEYLEELNREYDRLMEEFKSLGCKVVSLQWNDFGNIEYEISKILSESDMRRLILHDELSNYAVDGKSITVEVPEQK